MTERQDLIEYLSQAGIHKAQIKKITKVKDRSSCYEVDFGDEGSAQFYKNVVDNWGLNGRPAFCSIIMEPIEFEEFSINVRKKYFSYGDIYTEKILDWPEYQPDNAFDVLLKEAQPITLDEVNVHLDMEEGLSWLDSEQKTASYINAIEPSKYEVIMKFVHPHTGRVVYVRVHHLMEDEQIHPWVQYMARQASTHSGVHIKPDCPQDLQDAIVKKFPDRLPLYAGENIFVTNFARVYMRVPWGGWINIDHHLGMDKGLMELPQHIQNELNVYQNLMG